MTDTELEDFIDDLIEMVTKRTGDVAATTKRNNDGSADVVLSFTVEP